MIAGVLCPQCSYHRVGPIEDKDGAIGPVTILCACPRRSKCATCRYRFEGRISTHLNVGGFVRSIALFTMAVLLIMAVSGIVTLRYAGRLD